MDPPIGKMQANVGLRDRLTFSAFGPAVNEVQRLESLTKKYPAPIIASEEFVDYCGSDWTKLGTERVPGIERELTDFAPAPVKAE